MSLKIDIFTNFDDLQDMMHELGNKDVLAATRAAMNNSLRRSKAQGSLQIRRRINLKPAEIKKRIQVVKARGGNLRSLEGALIFSGEPIGMINFIVGSKKVINQKGVKVKKRRKLKARVKGGKTFRLNGAFIQDITSKQVFRHVGKGRRAKKISVKSLGAIVFERKISMMFDTIFEKRFERQFNKQIKWRWDKTSAKYSRSPMRIPR